MARTKRGDSAHPPKTKTSQNTNKTKVLEEIIKQKIDAMEKHLMDKIAKKEEEDLQALELFLLNKMSKFPKKLWLKTIGDILNLEVDNSELSATTVCNDHTTSESSQSTRSMKKNTSNRTSQRTRALRSLSASGGYDEGYSTSESSRGTHSGGHKQSARQSRSRTKNTNTQLRVSRSLSKTIKSKASAYKTPINKAPPTNTGTITPKCKVGTPLMCVRRPKLGEMAWSHHGSPLMVSSTVVNEESANINIPLGDQILSLLPTRGPIEGMQLPPMEDRTVRQLETLRDNLISFCNKYKQ